MRKRKSYAITRRRSIHRQINKDPILNKMQKINVLITITRLWGNYIRFKMKIKTNARIFEWSNQMGTRCRPCPQVCTEITCGFKSAAKGVGQFKNPSQAIIMKGDTMDELVLFP